MKRIEYISIDLVAAARVFIGKAKVDNVAAVNDVKITRVIDGVTDVFYIEGPSHIVVPGYEVEARNVVGGVRKPTPAPVTLKGAGGKAKEDAA